MCPTTVENAVFYMDSFFAMTLQRGHELVVRDFQVTHTPFLMFPSLAHIPYTSLNSYLLSTKCS